MSVAEPPNFWLRSSTKDLTNQERPSAYLQSRSCHRCTQGPGIASVWSTMCCCEHTRVCVCVLQNKINAGLHPGSTCYKGSPTRCCCEPTHTCCTIFAVQAWNAGLHPRKSYKDSIQCCCERTHTHTQTCVYVLQENQFWLGFADQALL